MLADSRAGNVEARVTGRISQLPMWQRIRNKLQQTNIWLVIALLALGGWTLDALRMFLQMHDVLAAGLINFAGHFWYAIPVTAAIVVLSRLQPRAELLGLAVYDESGKITHQQGEFRLDEFAARGMLAALPKDGQPGLHGISLPTGARVYFLRQGACTLMLSYSGSAAPEDLAAGVQKLRAVTPTTTFDLLDGLDPATAALAVNVISSPARRSVLAFFNRYSRTSMQVDDLAYWVGRAEAEVGQALEELLPLGLVERMCVCERTFYRLNRDPAVLEHLDRLFAWQERWQVEAQRLDSMVR